MPVKNQSFIHTPLVVFVIVLGLAFVAMYVVGGDRKGVEKFYIHSYLPTNKIQVMQGVQMPDKLPTQPIVFDQSDPSMPSVDGTSSAPKSLFMMTYNDVKPECCSYSPYSTSSGCVCLTKDQVNFVASRGFNNKADKCAGVSDI